MFKIFFSEFRFFANFSGRDIVYDGEVAILAVLISAAVAQLQPFVKAPLLLDLSPRALLCCQSLVVVPPSTHLLSIWVPVDMLCCRVV